VQFPAAIAGEHTAEILENWGFTDKEISHLKTTKAI
jgi:crotonobetainyl-CoA:carnitine CoA-transferase CaiB-like acyl-CoA transferase